MLMHPMALLLPKFPLKLTRLRWSCCVMYSPGKHGTQKSPIHLCVVLFLGQPTGKPPVFRGSKSDFRHIVCRTPNLRVHAYQRILLHLRNKEWLQLFYLTYMDIKSNKRTFRGTSFRWGVHPLRGGRRKAHCSKKAEATTSPRRTSKSARWWTGSTNKSGLKQVCE